MLCSGTLTGSLSAINALTNKQVPTSLYLGRRSYDDVSYWMPHSSCYTLLPIKSHAILLPVHLLRPNTSSINISLDVIGVQKCSGFLHYIILFLPNQQVRVLQVQWIPSSAPNGVEKECGVNVNYPGSNQLAPLTCKLQTSTQYSPSGLQLLLALLLFWKA